MEGPDMELYERLVQWARIGPVPPWLEPVDEEPSESELEQYSFDGVVPATDGCRVEPDGYCEHGHVSWFLYLGVI